MKNVIAPLILNGSSWPDTIRKDLHSATHKFMSALVQGVNAKQGDTVLYIPSLDTTENPAASARDKELVQLLETCVIHATRQVKDMLNRQDDQAHSDSGGPLGEIEFWRERSEDLSRIREQMDSPECRHIVKVGISTTADHSVWEESMYTSLPRTRIPSLGYSVLVVLWSLPVQGWHGVGNQAPPLCQRPRPVV